MKIIIETIEHEAQRYPTVGDYWQDEDGTRHIVVSKMGNSRYEFLVAIHEMIEQMLCELRGIKEEDITEFDKAFEAARAEGNTDEPGDDPRAPYKNEHFFATNIERVLALEMEVDWKTYDDKVSSL